MFDATQEKIMHATMELIMERGYSCTTTKDIAVRAGINECTIFRKFKGKKDIVLEAMTLPEWNPQLEESDFTTVDELETDLISFSQTYFSKVTPHMVRVSIGLRTPELFPDTAAGIMEIPNTFMKVVMAYLERMYQKGHIQNNDFQGMALQFLAMNLGFVFLKASFGDELTEIQKEEYINNSVRTFINGIKLG